MAEKPPLLAQCCVESLKFYHHADELLCSWLHTEIFETIRNTFLSISYSQRTTLSVAEAMNLMKRMCLDDQNQYWEPAEHSRLCSLHFISGQPSADPAHPDYCPSIFSSTSQWKQSEQSLARFHRSLKRRQVQVDVTSVNSESIEDTSTSEVIMTNATETPSSEEVAAYALLELVCSPPKHCDKGTDPGPDPLRVQFDELSLQYIALQKDYQLLLNEIRDIKEQQKHNKSTYSNLDDKQISVLTGVPSKLVFEWILSLIAISIRSVAKLNKVDMLLVIFMKLKLNLINKDLAMRFNISHIQISRILNLCLPILSRKLKFLIRWPDRETVIKNMPKTFGKSYRKCRVIIDCSEIFIQRPSNLDARAKTWSNYKHHNTMKFLIGITPYGSISFLSKCWGGRVSDKELTLKSGFYGKLERGDLVLADREFLIEDELAAYGASLATPPFAKGKTQFSQRAVESARKLSQSRIHVERAIERVKRFQILKHVIAISLLKHADSVITICAAVTNLHNKLVK